MRGLFGGSVVVLAGRGCSAVNNLDPPRVHFFFGISDRKYAALVRNSQTTPIKGVRSRAAQKNFF